MERKIDYEHELKTALEIAQHFPRREKDVNGNQLVGVSRSTVLTHIAAGRLKLQEVWFKGHQYFVVPVEDQLADLRTWRLGTRYKAKKKGRPSNAARLGLK